MDLGDIGPYVSTLGPAPVGAESKTAAKSEVRPATDLVIAQIHATIAEVARHDHDREDWFCLNQYTWMGERMKFVLARLAQEQAATVEWKARYDALAAQVEAGEYRNDPEVPDALAVGVDIDGIRAHVGDLDGDRLRQFALAAVRELVRARRLLQEAHDTDSGELL